MIRSSLDDKLPQTQNSLQKQPLSQVFKTW